MKKLILIVLFLITAASYPIMAQDTDTAVPTEEVSSETAEPTALETVEPVPVTVAPTDIPPAENGDQGSSGGLSGILDFATVGAIVLLLVFGAIDRWTNFRLSKEAINQVPAAYLPAVLSAVDALQKQIYERANTVTQATVFTWDEAALKEEMARSNWEFYTDPVTGQQLARKKLSVG